MANLSGLWSLGSSVINAVSQHQTNQANDLRQRRQNDYNFRMWELNNQYNDPMNQMKRLERAGINPNILYGQNAGGASGTSSSPSQGVSPFQAQSPVQTDPLMLAQLDLLRSQKYKTDMEGKGQDIQNEIIDKTGLQQAMANLGYTQQQIAESIEKVEQWHLQNDNIIKEGKAIDQSIENMKVSAQEMQQKISNMKLEGANLEELGKIYVLQQNGLKLTNEQQEIMNKRLPQILDTQIAKDWQEIEESKQRIQNYQVDNAYKKAQTLLVGEQTETQKQITKRTSYEVANEKIENQFKGAQEVADLAVKTSQTAKNCSDALTPW